MMYLDLSDRNIDNNNINFYNYKRNIKPTVIDLSHNNIGNGNIENILLLLNDYSQIEELNLSWNELEFNSIKQLSNWLSNKNIQKLNINLHNYKFPDIVSIIPIFNYVKSIDISNSLINNDSLMLIADNIDNNLLELKIGSNLYNNIDYLLNKLIKNNKLNSLCIYNSKLNNNNFYSLLELLLFNKNIIKLNIGNNDFTIDKFLLLVDIINTNKNFKYLSIKNSRYLNQISTKLLNDSFNIILNSNIIDLDISGNNNIYDNYSHFLTKIIDNKFIKHLNISYCNIEIFDIYNMIKSNHNLITLNYGYYNDKINDMIYYNKIYNNIIDIPKDIKLFRMSFIISLYQLLPNEIFEELSNETIKLYVLYLKYNTYKLIDLYQL